MAKTSKVAKLAKIAKKTTKPKKPILSKRPNWRKMAKKGAKVKMAEIAKMA